MHDRFANTQQLQLAFAVMGKEQLTDRQGIAGHNVKLRTSAVVSFFDNPVTT